MSHRLCEVGPHVAGADEGYADISAAEFGTQRLREADDGVLGCCVWADERGAEKPAHRGSVHDVALQCGGEHAWYECTHTVDHTPQTDVDRPGPVLFGEFPLPTEWDNPGVVANHMHLPEGIDSGWANASTATPLRTSVIWPKHSIPSDCSSITAWFSDSSDISERTTRMPSRPNSRAIPNPIPDAAPVMTATFDSRLSMKVTPSSYCTSASPKTGSDR